MRVVSGRFRGQNLKMVPGDTTRPTSAKVKEAIFSMVAGYGFSGNFLDLFAGTGSMGIEAVSRGFDKAYLVDKSVAAIKTIEENCAKTHDEESFVIIKDTATAALNRFSENDIKFNMVFLDPPYKLHANGKVIDKMLESDLLNDSGIVIVETDYEFDYENSKIHEVKRKNYGDTFISIFQYEE